MSDEHLRELERRWRESDADEDQAALLSEWVRTGDLSQDRLRLASYCGHRGATLALGKEAPARPADLADWVSDFGCWGSEVGVRVAIALARLGLPLWTQSETLGTLQAILSASRAWLADPTPARRAEAATFADEQGDLPFTPSLGANAPGPVAAALAVLAAAQEIRDSPSSESSLYTASPAKKLAGLLGEATVRQALKTEVGDWALARAPRST